MVHRESELLAAPQDPDHTYLQEIMPEKLRINLEYAAKATVWGDFRVIMLTLGLWPASREGEEKKIKNNIGHKG